MFCIFWFIANWSVNASLDYTSVASATILSSLSGKFHITHITKMLELIVMPGFFTLIIGRLFQVESLTLAKAGAVVLRSASH